MGETLLGKNCTSCDHFTSYYEEYDFDELEPTWCGRCPNKLEKDNDDYVDEEHVCHLWEKIKAI